MLGRTVGVERELHRRAPGRPDPGRAPGPCPAARRWKDAARSSPRRCAGRRPRGALAAGPRAARPAARAGAPRGAGASQERASDAPAGAAASRARGLLVDARGSAGGGDGGRRPGGAGRDGSNRLPTLAPRRAATCAARGQADDALPRPSGRGWRPDRSPRTRAWVVVAPRGRRARGRARPGTSAGAVELGGPRGARRMPPRASGEGAAGARSGAPG